MMEGTLKNNIDKLIEELRFIIKSEKEIEDIIQVLDSIVDVSKTSFGENTECIIDDVFLTLLHHESKEIIAKTAKAIAEIAKSEKGREKCTSTDLINALLDLLNEECIDILIQTSRALGNICYENENGKKFIENRNGLILILTVLKKSVTLKNEESLSFLRNVAAGLLLNFLIDQPSLHTKELQEKIVPIICNILEIDGTSGGEAAMHSLLILELLNDANKIFLDERLTTILVNMLSTDTSSELSEICLELLHGQAEDENTKLLLAKAGVCELLLNLLEKHSPYCTDEETRSVLKIACNLIVLILTGDNSMNSLYDKSNGITYKKLVKWLENKDKDLQITAVLAMGNFARSDTHCKLMVTQGVHRNLLKLLQRNNTNVDDIRFQHALLSALRNLVIPMDNKPIILTDGLINILYSMLNISSYPVVFKLLGTLRIVIDGQSEAAIELGKKNDLIKKVVNWCEVEEHPGVQGEANRLIAWLINNSRNKDIAHLIIEHGAVKHLVKMLTTPHVLMLNEALISLMILTTISLTECENLLLEADIGEKLCNLFNDKSNLEIPILHNVLCLIDNIINSEALKEHLRKTDLIILCQETNLIKKEEKLNKKLEKICKIII
ncbi:rap1 GTPase-GDP dissociation stimulator 1-B isoform X1 [Apis mellifera caucasica]|uniref:Rap1 GTPase-GDP dissociation stimulator 1-B isoform X1 n=1 Tax=Apis mellifera TaxID=7460 RepID=A0A7M7MNM1_APIME|nr:rap1 GTPase-GDP dissociation stimulator 1-B isoform X1 [Apis mellifera]KAG6804618.1 rap1 GTPase-GDP dissociation stimulator 1-B isoform X1 [Apis mellifera caucasica]KAG9431432.1 rap1 GTPase-GDP dissociation stimulator 1-B isoform X1 [Apis mellifera carnica]|eukprot:XP_026298629.1 rap1 GTPase-GDP dissociation stimulator 1-B isoform X1 [Apis mellifera]